MMKTLLQDLLGTTGASAYVSAFIFSLIGAIISLRMNAKKRNKLSPSTPVRFSWKFLLQDNLQRLINGFLLTFVAFRFSNEWFGLELTPWTAFLIGLLNDRLAGLIGKLELKARE